MPGSAGSARGQGQRWRLPKATDRCGSATCTWAYHHLWPGPGQPEDWEFVLEVWALLLPETGDEEDLIRIFCAYSNEMCPEL